MDSAALNVAAHRRAALAVLILGVYLELVESVDLFPWNDVRRGNGQASLDIILGCLFALFTFGLWRVWRGMSLVSAFALLSWLGLQLWTFWVPYLGGASEKWLRIHKRWFADTVQWLPEWPGHPPPDANHILLQMLVTAALIFSVRAARSGK